MKRNKTLVSTVLILTLALMLSACSLPFGENNNTEPAATKAPTVTETPIVTETPVPEESAAPQLCSNEPAFATEFGVERFISQMSDLQSFTDAEGEFANRVLFTARRDVKDFRYLEISSELSDSGEIIVTKGDVLYTLDTMDAGDTLLIAMSLEGYLPDRAISYVDDCGGTHYYYVTISGEDNVPVLITCPMSK